MIAWSVASIALVISIPKMLNSMAVRTENSALRYLNQNDLWAVPLSHHGPDVVFFFIIALMMKLKDPVVTVPAARALHALF